MRSRCQDLKICHFSKDYTETTKEIHGPLIRWIVPSGGKAFRRKSPIVRLCAYAGSMLKIMHIVLLTSEHDLQAMSRYVEGALYGLIGR